jgi:septal ring factor EnvC (AmiA/AmiB activator)
MQEILKRLEDKVDQMDQRFSQMNQRFDQIDQRFDQIDQRFDTVETELHRQGVLLESMNSDLKQTMEGVTGNRQVLDNKFAEVLRKLDERVLPVELASRHFAQQLAAAGPGKRGARKKGA